MAAIDTSKSPDLLQKAADIAKLAACDREVRAHEAAHLAAAGGLAVSGASFSYQRGPDGKLYAVGGEVHIDTSRGRTSEETIAKARQIRTAATAPAQPSGQDYAVAVAASQMEAQAMQELAQKPAQTTPTSGTPQTDPESTAPASDSTNSDHTGWASPVIMGIRNAYRSLGASDPPTLIDRTA